MNKILLLIIAFVLFQNCESGYEETSNGFLYKILKKGKGEKIVYGNYVYVWFAISTGDSTIFTTEETKGKEALLRDPATQSREVKDPVLDVLPLLNIGDSAIVIVEIDDLMRLTEDLKDVKKLYYTVVVKDMKTVEEKKKEEQEKISRRKEADENKLLKRTENLKSNSKSSAVYDRLRSNIKNHSKHPDLKKTDSGLEYIIFKQGNQPLCQSGEQIIVHYIGMQEEGLVFDETYTFDEPFSFTLDKGRVIRAWDEGIQLLGTGGEIFMKVPPRLGYGATGSGPLIQPNATIYFYVVVQGRK